MRMQNPLKGEFRISRMDIHFVAEEQGWYLIHEGISLTVQDLVDLLRADEVNITPVTPQK